MIIAKLLSLCSDDELDGLYHLARQLQHREEDGWFRNKKGDWQRCRMEATEWDDPIMQESGCAGDFANDFRMKDIRDGCHFCSDTVAENASEPDVMQRWGFR